MRDIFKPVHKNVDSRCIQPPSSPEDYRAHPWNGWRGLVPSHMEGALCCLFGVWATCSRKKKTIICAVELKHWISVQLVLRTVRSNQQLLHIKTTGIWIVLAVTTTCTRNCDQKRKVLLFNHASCLKKSSLPVLLAWKLHGLKHKDVSEHLIHIILW